VFIREQNSCLIVIINKTDRSEEAAIMPYQGMLLPGYACTSQIWQLIGHDLGATYDLTSVDWPVQITSDFHNLNDFTDWLYTSFWPRQCDFVIGHSMGGLVALQLAATGKVVIPKIILVETFLVSPSPFFQNLLLDASSSAPVRAIPKMLHREKASYSPLLREAIQQFDGSEPLLPPGQSVYALYGDRGRGQAAAVLNELGWTEQLLTDVAVKVIPNACHFPMVENPQETAEVLRRIIDTPLCAYNK
jgi:pimeloyl-ACP methyl ester carboxylesterase